MEVPQKIKNGTTILFTNPTSAYISKGDEITLSKRYLDSHVHCSIIHNSQDMETTEVSIYIDFVLKKGGKSCHLQQHGGPYAK